MIKWLVITLVLLSLQNHFGELTEAENFIEDQITGKIDFESGLCLKCWVYKNYV